MRGKFRHFNRDTLHVLAKLNCYPCRPVPPNGPNSATISADFRTHDAAPEPRASGERWVNVMKNDGSGTFGIIVGGVVAAIAVIFILTGGELGGKKTVESDQDLPPVTTTDK